MAGVLFRYIKADTTSVIITLSPQHPSHSTMPSLPIDFAIPARSSYASATYEDSITSKPGTGLLVFLRTCGWFPVPRRSLR